MQDLVGLYRSAVAGPPGDELIACDGCRIEFPADALKLPQADGHEARYCADCHDAYKEFAKACEGEEARLNRLLSLFIEEARSRLTLRFVPQDLPARPKGGLILG